MLLQFGALGVTMSWDDDFLPLGGYLFSLGVFLRGPSRTPFRVFSNPLESLRGPPSRPLAEPSRASSNPLVALRRSSWPFVDIFFGRSSLVPQLVSKKRRSGPRRLSKTTLSTYSAAKPLRLCHTAGQMPAGLPPASVPESDQQTAFEPGRSADGGFMLCLGSELTNLYWPGHSCESPIRQGD